MGEHSEDDKAVPEMNKKRTVKTRAQVEALEKFYDEHKYPSEIMKEEFAKSIGLTDKQVSGWFCHRRLKDKRLLNPEAYRNSRQDRSSGIIQDRGSGLRQDSCGSTKQGDDKNFDPKEVESRRSTGQVFSAADFTYELASHCTRNHGSPDDTSSGSSYSLRNMSFPDDGDHFARMSSRYQTKSLPVGIKEVKPRTGPSGYLKVKGQVENAAITAVKRQLGKHYRADGPPLGIDFDPLPPGAFTSPIQETPNDSYCVEEPVLPHSPEVSVVRKNPNLGTVSRYHGSQYILKTSSLDSDMDRTRFKMAHGSDHSENLFQQKYNQNSPLYNHGDFYAGKSLSVDIHEGSARKSRVYDSQDTDLRDKRGVGGMNLDSVSGLYHSHLYASRINSKQAEPSLQDYDNMSPKVAAAEHFDHKPLSLTSKGVEYEDFKHKGLSRRLAKKSKNSGEKLAIDGNMDTVRPKVSSGNGLPSAKGVRNELCQEQYIKKASWNELQPWTNQVPRSAAEMPTSFSEDDEAVDTSSSAD